MKIKELRENKCMQAALAVLFSVLLCLLAFLLDNRGILGLPREERGTRQVSGQVTEEETRIELSGGYVDRLSFAVSGEIRVKPSAEEDWITFPVGSRTLDLEERICPVSGPGEEAAGEEACYVVYDKNPAALTRQYLPLGERVESVTVRAVEPGADRSGFFPLGIQQCERILQKIRQGKGKKRPDSISGSGNDPS